ncbi:hypothetical protein MLD38_036180 [Melastoma candidum]|uniref:Uncharacterized protein n=1 Tax=Melastoma candidum TaxID=119954 RepID=A0ACB9LIX7_9MYRT|nr:hypothetical protein MLD38_036180 [Melastoma candidum]
MYFSLSSLSLETTSGRAVATTGDCLKKKKNIRARCSHKSNGIFNSTHDNPTPQLSKSSVKNVTSIMKAL